jgi:histidinol-phosphate/aromatic aminotransferase/cobyric acid decarboxylase-like protein
MSERPHSLPVSRRDFPKLLALGITAAGRPFPPMTGYLRVSIGTEPQMERFLQLFRIICGPLQS